MFGITGPNKCDRTSVAENLPIALGALDGGGRACAFEGLAWHEAIIGPVNRHCDELSKISHGVSLTFLFRETRSSADALTQVNCCCAARASCIAADGTSPSNNRTSLKHCSAANM